MKYEHVRKCSQFNDRIVIKVRKRGLESPRTNDITPTSPEHSLSHALGSNSRKCRYNFPLLYQRIS